MNICTFILYLFIFILFVFYSDPTSYETLSLLYRPSSHLYHTILPTIPGSCFKSVSLWLTIANTFSILCACIVFTWTNHFNPLIFFSAKENRVVLYGPLPAISVIRPYFFTCTQCYQRFLGLILSLFPSGWLLKILLVFFVHLE